MAANNRVFLFYCLFLAYFYEVCNAKIVSGTITPDRHRGKLKNWEFVARFCFKSDAVVGDSRTRSTTSFQFHYPKKYYMQYLLLYYDEEDQWPAVYPNPRDKTCKDLVRPLTGANQVIPLAYNQNMTPVLQLFQDYPYMQTWGYWEKCKLDEAFGLVSCTFEISFRSTRDRWWYLAVANCDSEEGLYLDYQVNFTNGPPEDILFHHFSADEFYILQTDLGFLAIEFVMVIITSITVYFLVKLDYYHTTFKLYLAALILEVVRLVIVCWSNGVFAHTGIESRFSKYLGLIIGATAYIIFILMLILMAKGYTITRGRLRTVTIIKITVFIIAYIILYLAMFLWEMMIFDEGLVTYRYESIPGYILCGMRVLAWIWFLYAIVFTLKHYPEKKMFYIPFVVLYSFWFLLGPLVVIIAVFAMPAWLRSKTVNGVENLVTLAGQIFFLILTRPSAANVNFPFRVRTWQISVMEGEDLPPIDGEAPAYGAAAKYQAETSTISIFTASDFREPRKQLSPVGNINRFPHHQANDYSHFTTASNVSAR